MQRLRPTDARALCAELITRWPDGPDAAIVLDRPKDPRHGDYACNVALQLARGLKRPPREIAEAIVTALPASAAVQKAEVAGAGFINLHLERAYKQGIV